MKRTLLLLAFLLLISVSFADVYTIGTGTNFGNNWWPVNSNAYYGWTKMIYTKAQINTAGLSAAGNITGLAFQIGNSLADSPLSDQRVYIRHTTLTSYSTATDETGTGYPNPTGFTQVFQGNVIFYGSNWFYIMFSTPFNWNNSNNIEILWENRNGMLLTIPVLFKYASFTNMTVRNTSNSVFPTTAGSRNSNRPNLRLITSFAQVPSTATAYFPADNSRTFTDCRLRWVSMPGSYDVYFGATNPPPYIQNQSGTKYDTPALAPNTTYYWQIVPRNEAGPASGCPVWSFTTVNDTLLAESFEGEAFPPPGWHNPGFYNHTPYSSLHGDKCIYKDTYTSYTPYLLSTPLLSIENDSKIEFYALTSSSFNDKMQIRYSEDRINWYNLGSQITFSSMQPYTYYSIDLGPLALDYEYLSIGFEFSTVNTYGKVYLDHIIGPDIAPIPPSPVTLSYPQDQSTLISITPNLTWQQNLGGGVPDGYRIYLDTNPNPTTLIETVLEYSYEIDVPLQYSTTYYWKVVAFNDYGNSDGNAVYSFTTRPDPVISNFPYSVDFSSFPPYDWSNLYGYYGGTLYPSDYWQQDDWQNKTFPVNKAAKINLFGTSRYAWLVTPPINVPAGTYELLFAACLVTWNTSNSPTPGGQYDDRLLVVMSDSPDMSNPTILREWNNTGSADIFDQIPAEGEYYLVPLTGVAGIKYFAFFAESQVTNANNDLMIDNVIIRQQPPVPVFGYYPSGIDFGNNFQQTPSAWQFVNIVNLGTGTLTLGINDVSITGPNAGSFAFDSSYFPYSLVSMQSHFIPIRMVAATEGDLEATLNLTYGDVTYLVELRGYAFPQGLVTIGNGTLTTVVPVYPTYTYTYSQCLYYPSEIGFNDRAIERIYYYWNGTSNAVNSNLWNIYLGLTNKTVFSSGTDWVTAQDLTLVFSGEVPLPAIEGWIEITLDEPFTYLNTYNLVIAVDENEANSDGATAGQFLGTVSDVFRGLVIYGGTNYDPAVPPTGYNAGRHPNIMLKLEAETGIPVLSVTPLNWDFGSQPLSGIVYKQFTVTNSGTGNLDISSIGISGDYFTLTQNPAPVSLGEGQSAYFTVKYNPLAYGTHTGTVTITDGRAITEVELTAVCFDASISTFPSLQNFDGDAFPPEGWISLSSDDLRSVGIWSRATAETNPTCTPHSGIAMAMYNSADVYLTRGSLVSPPLNLVPGVNYRARFWMYHDDGYPSRMDQLTIRTSDVPIPDDYQIHGSFFRYYEYNNPDAMPNQWYEYEFTFMQEEPTGQPLYIIFTAEGHLGGNIYIDDITFEEVPPAPIFSLNNSAWDFGNLLVDESATRQVSITNIGNADGDIISIEIEGTYFSLLNNPAPCNLEPEESVYFTVQYNPTVLGEHNGVVTITYDIPFDNVKQVLLSGACVNPPVIINTFPWTEDFECGIFPPEGWTSYDLDDGGTFWVASTAENHTQEGTTSALHAASDETPYQDGGQSGWLVSPPVVIPPLGGDLVLSFWTKNINPQNHQYSRIWVSTDSPDPDIGPYYEFESIETVYDEWTYHQIFTLWVYEYQTIHIAFKYGGYDADDWYLDDISIYVPELANPVITHLPLLNCPNPDLSYQVSAEITEPEYPIAAVYLVYSANGNDPAKIRLVNASGNTYTASIPPLALNSEAEYWFEVLAEQCYPWFSQPYYFDVADPTWLLFDYGTDFDYYAGYDTYGVVNIYSNPFYETEIPLQINAVKGSLDYPGTATLKIYSYQNPSFPELIHSQQVYFEGSETTFDLTSLQLTTVDPYLMIGFYDISPTRAFMYNATYDYGISYLYIGESQLPATGKTWKIGVNLGAYQAALDNLPPIISHLPHLNTPLTDVTYRITAEIVDDPTYNNPITAASLFYLPGEGMYIEVPLTHDTGNVYYADIPAQPLDTQVEYYLRAQDSQNNVKNTPAYFFTVENPTWLSYLGDEELEILGSFDQNYAALNIFDNPFYGTETPLKVNMLKGRMVNNNPATLVIYSYDGYGQINLAYSQQVNFISDEDTTFDFTSQNVTINTQYLLVGFADIPAGYMFYADASRDYGKSILHPESGIPEYLSGASWLIGANITNGAATMDIPSVWITTYTGGSCEVYWDAVDGALSYKVYGSATPYDSESWSLLDTTDECSYPYYGSEDSYFFKVVASSESPARAVSPAQIQRTNIMRLPYRRIKDR